MKLQGLWMQSVGLMLFVGDVHLAHDSSMTVEARYLCSGLRLRMQAEASGFIK